MTGVLLLVAVAGAPVQHDCFHAHVEEAIALNTARREIYAAATRGASLTVSDDLIRAERLSLLIAPYFDLAARTYQRAGIPVLCAEFVPMSGAAPLPASLTTPGRAGAGDVTGAPSSRDPARAPSAGDTASASVVAGDALRSRLAAALDSGGFHRLRWAAEWELLQLEKTPERHCMVRHLVESVRRAAALAPVHAAAAREKHLPSPLPLSRHFVQLQLATLPAAAELDAHAAPLQRAGVPILCADLPPIPVGAPSLLRDPRRPSGRGARWLRRRGKVAPGPGAGRVLGGDHEGI